MTDLDKMVIKGTRNQLEVVINCLEDVRNLLEGCKKIHGVCVDNLPEIFRIYGNIEGNLDCLIDMALKESVKLQEKLDEAERKEKELIQSIFKEVKNE